MSLRVPRTIVTGCVILTLIGCADSNDSMRDGRLPLSVDSENIRAVRGEPVDVSPLTPEPGDIWADVAVPKQQPSPVAQQAAPTPAAVATVSTPAAERPVSTAAPASYAVQLTAAGTEAAARHEWQQLRQRVPDVIGSREPSVMPAEVDGHQLWRLRAGGFATRADAAAFCDLLQSRHSSCWVVATGS